MKNLLLLPTLLLSCSLCAEVVELSGGERIEVHDDGTWTSLDDKQGVEPIEVDFYDYIIDPDAYLGKTIAVKGRIK